MRDPIGASDGLNSLLLGVILGVSASILLGSLAFALLTETTVIEWVLKWQTLLTGILALAGACVTVRSMNAQSRQFQKQYQDQIERKQYSARTSAPAALAEMHKFVASMLDVLRSLPDEDSDGIVDVEALLAGGQSMPIVPIRAMDVLGICTETADDKSRTALFECLKWTQIVHSRVAGILDAGDDRSGGICLTGYDLAGRIVDVLELMWMVDNLYHYARGDTGSLIKRPNLEAIAKRALFNNVGDGKFRYLDDVIRSRFPAVA